MQYLQIFITLLILAIIAKPLFYRKSLIKASKTRKMVLDSCALIDGRIVELARLGFVPEELIIPKFVIAELQLLADGRDAHKRDRARFGLDIVKELQDSSHTTVIIGYDNESSAPTDDKLVELASNLGAGLYTTDFNLNKVADIQGVRVFNVNELAQQLRPTALPGERQRIKILQKGSSPNQGVGYLEDGTMIVVDNAVRSIGRYLEVEVTRVHQTSAGKMMFARAITPRKNNVASDQTKRPMPRVGAKRAIKGR